MQRFMGRTLQAEGTVIAVSKNGNKLGILEERKKAYVIGIQKKR